MQEAERTADLESVEGSITIGGAAPGSKPKSAPTKTRRTRARRFEHLPKVTTRYELPADQRVCTCGNPLHVIGVDSCLEVASWAHARRKFVEAESSDPEDSEEIVHRRRELYAIEDETEERRLSDDDRKALWQERAVPLLQHIRARLAELETKVLPKSPLAKAIEYAFRQWEALTIYTTDGRLEIDNDAAERSLRGVAAGRKNWLCYMKENRGETGVILMSLLRTAIAAGVDLQAWLRDVLVRMDHERDYEKLLPAAWKLRFADELDAKRQDLIRRLAN
ncbi:MAG: transposase [Planctomycetota bacterium]